MTVSFLHQKELKNYAGEARFSGTHYRSINFFRNLDQTPRGNLPISIFGFLRYNTTAWLCDCLLFTDFRRIFL